MKYLLLSALMLTSLISFAQQGFQPDVAAINRAFYERYSTDGLEVNHLTFEKRLKDWYVTTYKIAGEEVKRNKAYLLYSGGQYQELPAPFTKTQTANQDNTIPVMASDIINYGLQPYYGYPGWFNDVILYYSQHQPITDSAFYGLARAYSSMANALLSDQQGDALPKETFRLKLANDCLSPEQIKKYDSVCQLAIANFKKVMDFNPAYQTIVGPIKIKYANEIMVPFHELMVYAPSEVRNYSLPDKIYPDTLLDLCRSYLNDCPPNAILLSSGDNDFYPVLYLQQHEGLRKDVYLVHIGLLAMDRYIYRSQFPQFDAKGVVTGLDTVTYAGVKNAYLPFDNPRQDATVTFNELNVLLHRKELFPRLTARNVVVREKSEKHSRIKAFYKGSALLKEDWVLLAIARNLGGRKLCTPYPIYTLGADEGLNPHFKRKHILFVLD